MLLDVISKWFRMIRLSEACIAVAVTVSNHSVFHAPSHEDGTIQNGHPAGMSQTDNPAETHHIVLFRHRFEGTASSMLPDMNRKGLRMATQLERTP